MGLTGAGIEATGAGVGCTGYGVGETGASVRSTGTGVGATGAGVGSTGAGVGTAGAIVGATGAGVGSTGPGTVTSRLSTMGSFNASTVHHVCPRTHAPAAENDALISMVSGLSKVTKTWSPTTISIVVVLGLKAREV